MLINRYFLIFFLKKRIWKRRRKAGEMTEWVKCFSVSMRTWVRIHSATSKVDQYPPIIPELWKGNRRFQDLAEHLVWFNLPTSCRLSERLLLLKVRWRIINKDTQHWPPASAYAHTSIHFPPHTYIFIHIYIVQAMRKSGKYSLTL